MTERDDQEFAEQLRNVLDAQSLPAQLAQRLRDARRCAVAAVPERPLRVPSTWIPVGALAATLLAVGLLYQSMQAAWRPPLGDDIQLAAVADLDVLENLEFAAWMVEADDYDEG